MQIYATKSKSLLSGGSGDIRALASHMKQSEDPGFESALAIEQRILGTNAGKQLS